MAYLNGMRVGARRSLLIVAALLIGLAVGFAVSRGDPALGYQAVILVGAGALPLSFGVAFETADGLRQILLIAIRVLLIAAIIMLKSSMLAYPVAPPVVQKPLPPPVPDCSAMPEAKPGEGLQPPRPCGDTSKWTNWADYPEAAARRGAEGAVSLAGTITAAGRLSDCHVLKGSGHADLDAATCPLLESRGRWLPGRDGKGKAIDTPFRVRFRWTIQDARTGA